jgi:hypothetical protein
MNVKFQAVHFAVYGTKFQTEICHWTENLGLIRDATRAVLDSAEYAEFVADSQKELDDQTESHVLRCNSCLVRSNSLSKLMIL